MLLFYQEIYRISLECASIARDGRSGIREEQGFPTRLVEARFDHTVAVALENFHLVSTTARGQITILC